MRRKISTLLDETLYRRAKLESVVRGKQISEIIGEALEKYLDERDVPGRGLGVVAETWGSLKLPASELHEIMAEEDWLDS